MSNYIPNQGDFVSINFDPQAGHEQSGKRPALVLSKLLYNQNSSVALFCPITNNIKGYPFEVVIPEKMKVSGVVLCDQIKSMDWIARKVKFIEKAPENLLNEVLEKFQTIII